MINHKRLALERLRRKASKLDYDLIVKRLDALGSLNDEDLVRVLDKDESLGDHAQELNLTLFSVFHEASAIDVEILLQDREAVHADRTVTTTKHLIKTYLRVLSVIQQTQDVEAEQIAQSIAIMNIVLNSNDVNVYKKFWRADETYSRPFKAFLGRCFTQDTMTWYLSDIILLNPKLYRICIGLKSQTAHIDKLCEMAQKYIQIPKLHLWDAYDRVLENSSLTEEEMFDQCKEEACEILEIDRRLAERDFDNGNMTAAGKWSHNIYQKIARDKGRAVLFRLQKYIEDDTKQLCSIWKQAKPVIDLFTDMNKDELKELLSKKGREMVPQLLNHIMETLQCDEKTRDFVRGKLAGIEKLL